MKPLPVTMKELLNNFDSFHGSDVEFQAGIETLESPYDRKMRARLIRMEIYSSDPDVVVLTLDNAPWHEYNDRYASYNYYDKNQVPCLSAKEAGFFRMVETMYFMVTDDPSQYFTLLPAELRTVEFTKPQLEYLSRLVNAHLSADPEREEVKALLESAVK